jgi:hypothetical protein
MKNESPNGTRRHKKGKILICEEGGWGGGKGEGEGERLRPKR